MTQGGTLKGLRFEIGRQWLIAPLLEVHIDKAVHFGAVQRGLGVAERSNSLRYAVGVRCLLQQLVVAKIL